MKLNYLAASFLFLSSFFSAYAAGVDINKPKHEMRSAWVATVWRLDWPQNAVTSTGNQTDIARQKKDMITLLDSMAINNMNAINFQVRNRSDALYKSSYEPWSSDLVATRGMDPGYDPLEFVVEESHKRGLECHAWINPYRFESQIGQWSGMEGDYRKTNPDWVMDYNGASILNPGKEEVIQRIVDICREIVTNYDVDGILYDDYFYLNGTPLSADVDLYNQYVADGGNLNQKDWRRDNVNRMLKRVYQMIQEVKPWVRFGVSPAGIACTTNAHAAKYGVERCTSGSDWQYDGIYSDPLAWMSQQSLDFISPQIYWTIGNTTGDYSIVAPWWSKVAEKFKRHFYSSHSISSLTASSKAIESTKEYSVEGVSNLERGLMQPKASGPNNTTFDEYVNEIKINRESCTDGAPGSIFYSCKYLYRTAPLFAHHLKKTVFSRPAILPAMTYKGGYYPGNVSNLDLNDNVLSWDGYDNVRYTVYAVPTNISQADFKCEAEYLLGTSYATSYAIPAQFQKYYQYAVCVLDRYGNEYSPIFYGSLSKQLDAPVLESPVNGELVVDPFYFSWKGVAEATNYIVEVSKDEAFKNIISSIHTNETTTSSSSIEKISNGVTHYWRVRSCATNCQDGVSVVGSFIPQVLAITAPLDGANGVSVAPTIKWTTNSADEGYLEISESPYFEEGTIMYTGTSTYGSIDVPQYTLKGYTKYYARVTMRAGDKSKTSEIISFTTLQINAEVPQINYPTDLGTMYSEDVITLEQKAGALRFKVEVASSNTFPTRTKYLETLDNFVHKSAKAGDIKISSKNLVAETTYYVRAQAQYNTADGVVTTDYCQPIQFVYKGEGSGVESNIAGADVKLVGGSNPMIVITAADGSKINVLAYSVTGVLESYLFDGYNDSTLELSLQDLPQGMHLIVVSINGVTKTLKFVK